MSMAPFDWRRRSSGSSGSPRGTRISQTVRCALANEVVAVDRREGLRLLGLPLEVLGPLWPPSRASRSGVCGCLAIVVVARKPHDNPSPLTGLDCSLGGGLRGGPGGSLAAPPPQPLRRHPRANRFPSLFSALIFARNLSSAASAGSTRRPGDCTAAGPGSCQVCIRWPTCTPPRSPRRARERGESAAPSRRSHRDGWRHGRHPWTRRSGRRTRRRARVTAAGRAVTTRALVEAMDAAMLRGIGRVRARPCARSRRGTSG